MKIAISCFSQVVRKKSRNLRRALIDMGHKVIPWENIAEADVAVVYNIHACAMRFIKTAQQHNKPIVSLQEGMYALGWKKTIPGMRGECERANDNKIMQIVWSNLERDAYISTGRNPKYIKAVGNPEYDDLVAPPRFTRSRYGIPDDAFVVAHIEQYAHPKGGPDAKDMSRMFQEVRRLTNMSERTWVIQCLHPAHSHGMKHIVNGRHIVRPFRYPIFDVLRMSDLVVTLSSTEGITAAILKKPIIQYDISDSPDRWGFVSHGVAVRAITDQALHKYAKYAHNRMLKMAPVVNYKKEYMVDGKSSERVAAAIIEYVKSR